MDWYEDERKERVVLRLNGGRKETMVKQKTNEDVVSEHWSYKDRWVKLILPNIVNVN